MSKFYKIPTPLTQFIGTWEIDDLAFEKAKRENTLHTLGVCSSHYLYDQNKLHKKHIKQRQSIKSSWIVNVCLFCNKSKTFFSRGNHVYNMQLILQENCCKFLASVSNRVQFSIQKVFPKTFLKIPIQKDDLDLFARNVMLPRRTFPQKSGYWK